MTDICFNSCSAGINIRVPISMKISKVFFLWGEGGIPFFTAWKGSDEVLGSPGLAWLGFVSGAQGCWFRRWVRLVRITFCTSFSVGDIYSRSTAMAGWVSGVTLVYMKQQRTSVPDLGMLKLLEKGQAHSLGWDLSDAWYQLHLNLTSPPGVPADIWVLFKYGGFSSRRKKGWVRSGL